MPFLQAGVRTLSVRRGVPSVFWTCIALLELAYAGGVATGLLCQVQPGCSMSQPSSWLASCSRLVSPSGRGLT